MRCYAVICGSGWLLWIYVALWPQKNSDPGPRLHPKVSHSKKWSNWLPDGRHLSWRSENEYKTEPHVIICVLSCPETALMLKKTCSRVDVLLNHPNDDSNFGYAFGTVEGSVCGFISKMDHFGFV